MSFLEELHKPDILDCISHLSSDEVFTPPKLVNEILDTLPQGLFKSPNTKFLDPCCKSGVFLREIAKRLIDGLAETIPDLEKRTEHIFKNQLFGLAITELTGLLSRRSVYCSKNADGEYSVCQFCNNQGNIEYKRTYHIWFKDKCMMCGASKSEYDRGEELETHAYSFIHTDEQRNSELFKRLKDMKFDVIIGNPPYQLGVGNDGGNSAKAKAIYHQFVSQAIKLEPKYITMIIPSRWMTRSVEGISDAWIDEMLNCNKIEILHDYLNAGDCFPGVEIKGGVCYFLYNKDYNDKCNYFLHDINSNIFEHQAYLNERNIGIVIRDINALSIIDKIDSVDKGYTVDEKLNFSSLVSPKDFYTNKETLTSSWKGYKNTCNDEYCIKYYMNKNIHKEEFGWIKANDISKNIKTKDLHKVYIPAAGGSGTDSLVLGTPFYGEPNSVCSQTYLVIGYNPELHNFTKEQCENIIKYIKTRFFRYLVSIKKKTQNGPRGVYQFVPIQDFNEEWTDEKLYEKYGLTQDEIDFIESMIRPME
ncbi:Eco57I restriction-modification methylase domain-containing protein [bacterium]|nr:Eco57I restriction-modification methylase domain-containing protein [bacterium]